MSFMSLITLFSVIGALSVALQHAGPANLLWSISNPILVYHNYSIGEVDQAAMFSVFAVMAVYGAVKYIRKHHKKDSDICFKRFQITGEMCESSGNCGECQQAIQYFSGVGIDA